MSRRCFWVRIVLQPIASSTTAPCVGRNPRDRSVAAVVEISALTRDGRTDEALLRAAEFEAAYGPIDWPAFARGAWTEAELNRVRADLVSVGMLPR